MENLLVAVNAVVPFMIYMGLGFLARMIKAGDEEFFNRLNSLVFKIFFPLLLFWNFYSMDISAGFSGRMVLMLLGSILIVTVLTFLIVNRSNLERNKKGVVIQAMFRGNMALFALPLAESVCGEAGRSAASLAVAISVPVFNMLAVVILESFHGERSSMFSLIKKVLLNPLIIGSIIGLIFLLLKIKLPVFLTKPISAIAQTTTPMALMTLGGTLHFSSLKQNGKILSVSLTVRMVLIPAILTALTVLFSFSIPERFVLFILYACPIAVSSYPMAANMGGDRDLAGQYVAVSTVVSLVTIFLWILVLKTAGII